MAQSLPELTPQSIGGGLLGGLFAWLIGYGLTYAAVGGQVRDSALNQAIEAFGEEPAVYEMVGWVFFNAHFVDTVFRDLPLLGSQTVNYIGGEDGFTVLLYLTPVVLLLLAGFLLAVGIDTNDIAAGAVTGLLVVPGYLLATIIGLVLTRVTIGDATGTPEIFSALILAGVVYPGVCAGIGGVIGGYLDTERV